MTLAQGAHIRVHGIRLRVALAGQADEEAVAIGTAFAPLAYL